MNKQDEEKAKEIAEKNEILYTENNICESDYKNLLDTCLEMAVWKEKQMIEKAVKFIDENIFGMLDDGVPYIQSIHDTSKNEFIEDFKKYMEEK